MPLYLPSQQRYKQADNFSSPVPHPKECQRMRSGEGPAIRKGPQELEKDRHTQVAGQEVKE